MKKKENLRRFYQRTELLDSPYTDGVYNEYGEQVIRPLTKEEEEFRLKFNREFVLGEFEENGNLHDDIITNNEDKVNQLLKEKKRINSLLRSLTLKTGYRKMSGEERKSYKKDKARLDKIKSLYSELMEIENKLDSLKIVSNIVNSNYASRRDYMSYNSFRDLNFDITQIPVKPKNNNTPYNSSEEDN